MARGTKTEVRPGVWRLRALSGYDPATGNPRQLSRTVKGGTRVAERELARFVAEAEAGEVQLGTDQTVAQFLASWLAFVEPLRSPTTIRGYRDKVRRWSAALGAKKVSKLTAQDLDRTYSRWLEEGAAPQTIQHCHRVLATALKQAQRWGLIARCATDLARPPASIHQTDRRRPFSDGRCDSFDRTVSHIARREDARHARFQRQRIPIELPDVSRLPRPRGVFPRASARVA